MNIFILDKSMEKSAQMLDDAHLISQINEGCQILMANYNKTNNHMARIGHINHPVTIFYSTYIESTELLNYLCELISEYKIRFGKSHQNKFWVDGYIQELGVIDDKSVFSESKTLVNDHMTDNIEEIREYIMNKPHKRALKWTNRDKPNWWRV